MRIWVYGHSLDDRAVDLDDPAIAGHALGQFVGSSSSRTENIGVTMRECGYTRYVL